MMVAECLYGTKVIGMVMVQGDGTVLALQVMVQNNDDGHAD